MLISNNKPLENMENHTNAGLFMPTWNVGYGPKEYGIYLMSRPRKKLKGWQRESKRKK